MLQVMQREILKTILYRNVAYKNSLVPTVIGEWNTLLQEIRDVPSFQTFSQKIISHVNKINNYHHPEYFSHGDRSLNILHTKLRHNCISVSYTHLTLPTICSV